MKRGVGRHTRSVENTGKYMKIRLHEQNATSPLLAQIRLPHMMSVARDESLDVTVQFAETAVNRTAAD